MADLETKFRMLREAYIEAEAGRLLAGVLDPTEEEMKRAYDEARKSLEKIIR